MTERLKVVVIGAGRRVHNVYGPILQTMCHHVEWIGVFSRQAERAQEVGKRFDVPAYTDINAMIEKERPDIAIVSVSYAANGPIGEQLATYGIHLLLETPIAPELNYADRIIDAAKQSGAIIEVAEQYYRRPLECLKQELLAAGVFGRILTAANDFMGHDYHGVSLIRSYIGFDQRVIAVHAMQRAHDVFGAAQNVSVPSGSETWLHSVLEFEGGQQGIFDFTSITYNSPIRWQRSTRFFGTHGMAVGDELAYTDQRGERVRPIRYVRRFHNVGGAEVVTHIVADTETPVVWTNPLSEYYFDDEMLAVALCYHSLHTAIVEGHEPSYGALQARRDQAVVLAMRDSAQRGGERTVIESDLWIGQV